MVNKLNREALIASIQKIESKCHKYEILKPVSFCYPAYKSTPEAISVLKELGYRFARAGGAQLSKPGQDDLLNLPQAFDSKPGMTFKLFKRKIDRADASNIPIITFHGVPDNEHPWVNTKPEFFIQCIEYLKQHNCRVTALRDYPEKS